MHTPQDRTIQVGKLCARYWAGGSAGSPVVLIHGLGEYVEIWSLTFGALTFQHRVYAVDLPGHGRSDKPLDASYDVASLAHFVKGFMDALGIEHAHMVGHSLGGAVSIRLALDHPESVDRLVLVGSGGLGRECSAVLRLISMPLVGEWLMRPSPSGAVTFFRENVHDVALVPHELLDLHDELSALPGRRECFLKTVRANINVFGQRPHGYRPHVARLASMFNPVLLAWGREDRVVPLAHGQAAARSLPDARLEVFEQCGHSPMLEHAEAFNQLVTDFLAG